MTVRLDPSGATLIELPDLPRGKAKQSMSDRPHWGARAIANDIIRQIRAGTLIPGQSLPPRRDLAALYHVSETTIYRAGGMLSFAGWVIGHQGRDIRIADPVPDSVEGPAGDSGEPSTE